MRITEVSSSSTSHTHHSDTEVEENVSVSRRKKTLLDKFNIPVEELDFDYVNKCTDPIKVERILRVLRSGEEGGYPDLEKCVEARLQTLKPSSRLLRVETPALRTRELETDEQKDIQTGLTEWLSAIQHNSTVDMSKCIFDSSEDADAYGSYPLPVRGTTQQTVTELKSQRFTNVSDTSKGRIKSWEYEKWDKFNVDAELTKLDIKDMKREEWERREKPKVIEEQKRIEKLMKGDGDTGSSRAPSTSQATPNPTKSKEATSKTKKQAVEATTTSRSYIEEIDDDDGEDGVQVSVPTRFSEKNYFAHPRKTKIVIEDLNLGI